MMQFCAAFSDTMHLLLHEIPAWLSHALFVSPCSATVRAQHVELAALLAVPGVLDPTAFYACINILLSLP